MVVTDIGVVVYAEPSLLPETGVTVIHELLFLIDQSVVDVTVNFFSSPV